MSEPRSDDKGDRNLFAQDACVTIWNKLRLFAHRRYRYLARRGVNLEGLILDVMIRESSGLSKRKRPEGVPMEVFLYESFRSALSHRLEREARLCSLEEDLGEDASTHFDNPARGVRRRPREGDPEEDTPPCIPRARKPPYQPRPEKIHMGVESENLVRKVLEIVGDDDVVLRRIVEGWLDDPGLKPQEVAEALGIPIEEMRRAKQRLARIISKLRKEWRHE